MFVALSKFVVVRGEHTAVKDAFMHRPHLVDDVPGFVRMEVMNPVDHPEEFWLVTYWQDQHSWQQWHKSHNYKASHKGIPKGLKLNPRETELRFFELFAT